ncbi:MAG: PIN domain-containing protein [Kiritimatiellaeota bacterium]|nr:PIN domain-containing protein [Kiritimatiellota bacterium]
MGVILDTCIWVEVERGTLAPADVMRVTGDLPVFLTPPVLAELEYGIYRAKTDDQRIRRMNAMMRIRRKPCLIMDRATAEIYGRLAGMLDNAGKPTTYRTHDVWIAALAIQHNHAVLTHNIKDFEGIPGLRLLRFPERQRRYTL